MTEKNEKDNKMIPISEAENLSKKYEYDQIIILALKESKFNNMPMCWKTTFNKDKKKCTFLGMIAYVLAYNFRVFYYNVKKTNEYYTKIINKEKVAKSPTGFIDYNSKIFELEISM